MGSAPVTWQPSLFGAQELRFDGDLGRVRRRELAEGAWVDHAVGWCSGTDELFQLLLDTTPWRGREVHMYERVVTEPRLTHRWILDEGPQPPHILRQMADVLSARYGVGFTQVGVNLYRNGADSVAWHGDRVARELPEATVALVSLGAIRLFRLWPTGGGASIAYHPSPGDLLVMGGSCQRTWQHAVPKVKQATARISIQFRHAYVR